MSRDARLDRLEDKMDTVVEVVTRLGTQFDGIPSRVRALEDKALQWETGRKFSLWLLGVITSAAGIVGGIISWFIKGVAPHIFNG